MGLKINLNWRIVIFVICAFFMDVNNWVVSMSGCFYGYFSGRSLISFFMDVRDEFRMDGVSDSCVLGHRHLRRHASQATMFKRL